MAAVEKDDLVARVESVRKLEHAAVDELERQGGKLLAAELRTNPTTARARLIAVTAYGSEQDQKRSREAGFQLHLVKPVKPESLLQQLDEPAKKTRS